MVHTIELPTDNFSKETRFVKRKKGEDVILSRVQVEVNYPRPSTNPFDSFVVSSQARQSVIQLSPHTCHALKDAIGKFLLTEFVPEVLLRIELRRVVNKENKELKARLNVEGAN